MYFAQPQPRINPSLRQTSAEAMQHHHHGVPLSCALRCVALCLWLPAAHIVSGCESAVKATPTREKSLKHNESARGCVLVDTVPGCICDPWPLGPLMRSSSSALLGPRCRRQLADNAILCCTLEHLSAETMQLISVTAAATLMLATGTTIQKPLLVPLFALQAPSSVVLWMRDDYGRWTAFLGLLLRLLHRIPGELELPLSTVLLVTSAPYQFIVNLRKCQGAAILSAAIAGYLMFQHFTRVRSLKKAFDREAIIATSSIICMTVTSLMLAF